MPAPSRLRRVPLLLAGSLAVLFPAAIPLAATASATAAPRKPVSAPAPAPAGARHPGRPVTLRGATKRSWRVTATTDRHPLRHPEAPAPGAAPTRLVDCTSRHPVRGGRASGGEGILALTMSAPGTSWANPKNTSVVVDVWVGRGRNRTNQQQIVLFDGARRFTYQAFVGRLTTGHHCVSVKVDPGRSTDHRRAAVAVYAARLRVVPKSSPDYQAVTHAPVLYARRSSSGFDAQLLTDVTAVPAGRDVALSYTVIWTRERVGDGQVPFYEWGKFGRMTDIETVLDERVAPSGRILSATYLSCGCESMPHYPDDQNAPPGPQTETQVAYPDHGTPPALGRHLVLRDATGNNDESPYGTTPYRMQQVPVAGPATGQVREVVMDRHPWTYRLSNEDLSRTSSIDPNPRSTAPGRYPQYLVVDIDTAPSGTSSISVGVQISGDSTWWTNDYAQSGVAYTGLNFYTGGHGRTVIKLPADWHRHRITALRLQLHPQAGQTASLQGKPVIRLIEVTPGFTIRRRPVPAPTIETG